MVIQAGIDNLIGQALASFDRSECRRKYLENDEFLVVEDFLPQFVLQLWDHELQRLKPHIHRTFIPCHKKGGSVGYETVRIQAPNINEVYQSSALLEFLREVVDAKLHECPREDPHRCMLDAYTEEGDHIGFHYDTPCYRDRRWTVLIGFQGQSSSRLICRLHTRSADRPVEQLNLQVKRGMLVLFNGDKVHHALTPLQRDESQFVVSMHFVTSSEMSPLMRFVSTLKESMGSSGPTEEFLSRK